MTDLLEYLDLTALLEYLKFLLPSAGIPAGHQLVDTWSAYPAYKIHSYKHLIILVILLFMCKMASGSPAITPRTFANLLLFTICNLARVWYWALYRITRTVKSLARTGVLIIEL